MKARWLGLKLVNNEERVALLKVTKLDYATLYPDNYRRQKVSLALNVFNNKTIEDLQVRRLDKAALFVKKIPKMQNILNVKDIRFLKGRYLNNPDKSPINDTQDKPLLEFALCMSTSL